jgi:hypothetical protein
MSLTRRWSSISSAPISRLAGRLRPRKRHGLKTPEANSMVKSVSTGTDTLPLLLCVVGNPNSSVYCASKGGEVYLTRSLALELAPQEIAASVLYLASAEAGFVTGAALPNDGGLTAGHCNELNYSFASLIFFRISGSFLNAPHCCKVVLCGAAGYPETCCPGSTSLRTKEPPTTKA